MNLQTPLDADQEEFLRKINLIKPDEKIISYQKAGEGNMNVVIRVITSERSFILKQSRAFVHKYPQIPAPLARIFVEKAYYDSIHKDEVLKSFSPEIQDLKEDFHLLVMEDLGQGSDFLGLYQGTINLEESQIEKLMHYLSRLHSLEVTDFPDNFLMKKLNHEHIFLYPFSKENGFDLNTIQPGLQSLALKYKEDAALKLKIEILGKRYLERGKYLLHGDFYPGSWLKVPSGIKVIDPEFAFMGDREFDLGVLMAHLKMAKCPQDTINQAIDLYRKQHRFDLSLLYAYIGIEILRRIIGLAQLPLSLSLDEKETLLEEAANLIKQ